MPGYLLHQGAVVQCSHFGQMEPISVKPRVRVGGMPITTRTPKYLHVVGCKNTGGPPNPCVSGSWTIAALRVKADGDPVLLFDSQGITDSTPNPGTLVVLSTQVRVRGT
jgi:hypothetical protein